jgi:subtilisin family serine protease
VVNGQNVPGYRFLSGTSMASPIVAGLAGLMKAARPDLTPAEIEAIILQTAVDVGAQGKDPQFGAGIINADAVVRAAVAYVRPAAPAPAPAPPAGRSASSTPARSASGPCASASPAASASFATSASSARAAPLPRSARRASSCSASPPAAAGSASAR